MTDILGLLQVSGELIVVEPKQRQVEELLAEYDEVSAACKNLLSEEEEIRSYEVECHRADEFITKYKTELYNYLHANKPPDTSVHYAASVRSHASPKRSSASDSRMHHLAKLAALESAQQYAEKEAELERLKLECERKQKALELQKEMSVAKAELSVYEQFDEQDSSIGSRHPPPPQFPVFVAGSSSSTPAVRSYQPASTNVYSLPQPLFSTASASPSSYPVVPSSVSNLQSVYGNSVAVPPVSVSLNPQYSVQSVEPFLVPSTVPVVTGIDEVSRQNQSTGQSVEVSYCNDSGTVIQAFSEAVSACLDYLKHGSDPMGHNTVGSAL